MNASRNIIARFSSAAAAIAVVFAASACGTEQAPPAQSVTVERQVPAKHMNRPTPIDPQSTRAQTTTQPDQRFMHGKGRPDSIG